MYARAVSLVLILVVLAGFTFRRYMNWTYDHVAMSEPVNSPDGLYVAQFYDMPEQSNWPYGRGAFVSPRFVPPWLYSDLVFASYCRRESLAWAAVRSLVVTCATDGTSSKVFPAPGGISIRLVKVPASNHSLERAGPAPRAVPAAPGLACTAGTSVDCRGAAAQFNR